MASVFAAAVRPARCMKQNVHYAACVLRSSPCGPAAPVLRGDPQACCSHRSDEPGGPEARVQTVRTYDEAQDKVYITQRQPEEDEDGSIATLVPGGLKSQRSSQGGAVEAEAQRERSRPLKINTDLKLVRSEGSYVQCSLCPSLCSRPLMSDSSFFSLQLLLLYSSNPKQAHLIMLSCLRGYCSSWPCH
jgi:hypothetical protein